MEVFHKISHDEGTRHLELQKTPKVSPLRKKFGLLASQSTRGKEDSGSLNDFALCKENHPRRAMGIGSDRLP